MLSFLFPKSWKADPPVVRVLGSGGKATIDLSGPGNATESDCRLMLEMVRRAESGEQFASSWTLGTGGRG